MEGIDRQEGVTELAILQASISVLIVSIDIKHQRLWLDCDAKEVKETVSDLFRCNPAFSIQIKYSESVNQIEVSS